MQFVHSTILYIYRSRTYVVEFLWRCKRGWSSNKQVGTKTTPMDLIYIEELDEDEGVEHQSMEEYAT